MTNLDALFEFLAKEDAQALEKFARGDSSGLHDSLADYLPDPGSADPESIAPDSEESAEAATVGESYLLAAGRTWWKLTPDARAALLVIFETATGKESVSVLNESLEQFR